MLLTRLYLDRHAFIVDPAEDLAELRKQIVRAVHNHGDFVRFRAVGHGVVDALVTPASSVRFDTVERLESARAITPFSVEHTLEPAALDDHVLSEP